MSVDDETAETAETAEATGPGRRRPSVGLVAALVVVVIVALVAVVALVTRSDDSPGVVAGEGDDHAVSDATTIAPEDIGPELPAQWTGVRTDGSALIITFYGAAPVSDPNDPCESDYRPVLDETAQAVTVTMHGTHVDACPEDIAYGRTVRVELAQPLGARQLTNGATGRAELAFDGARLLQPGWLPDGWQQIADRPSDPGRPGLVLAWQIGWGDPTTVTSCGAEVSPVTLTVGSASDLLTQTWVTSYTTVGATTVRGHPAEQARYQAGPVEHPSDETMIRWSEGDEGYVIRSAPSCPGDAPADFVLLQRLGDGLS